MAGVPLLVVNDQQDSRFLIHNPVLCNGQSRRAVNGLTGATDQVRKVPKSRAHAPLQ
jgi:hypothetical protein